MRLGRSITPARVRGRVRIHFICECDECGRTFTSRGSQTTRLKHDPTGLTFCSRPCMYTSPARTQKRNMTNVARYGVEHPMRSLRVKEKLRRTCLERYGVGHHLASDSVKRKIQETIGRRYSVRYACELSDFHSKRKATWLQRYGVDSPMRAEEVRKKFRSTCMKLYGVDNPFKAAPVKEKIRQTNIERYGVESPMQSAQVRARVDHGTRLRRMHRTMKQGGAYGRGASAAEDDFYTKLCEALGADAVERHVEVNGWCIDFHIEPIDLYIQFDGVYWHGLDRPIEVIQEFRSPRDRTIYGTWLRDRKQDAWFEENGMLLLRVTDRDDWGQFIDALLDAREA